MSASDPLMGKSAEGLFSNKKLEVYTLFSLAALGLFFKMFVPQNTEMSGSHGPATTALWGYGVSIIAIICILFITYGLTNRELMSSKNFSKDIKDGFFSNVGYILADGNIFVIVLVVLTLILVLNYVYYQKINIGIVPESFNQFNYVSNLFMIIQFLLLFQFINLHVLKSIKNPQTIGIVTAATYFLSTINIIFVIIMYILLKYYSTDG